MDLEVQDSGKLTSLVAIHSRAWGRAIAPVNTLAGALVCSGNP